MALILNIETATKNCSVSISQNGNCLAIKEANDGNYSHAEKLHVFIDEILKEQNYTVSDLDAIAVGKGPGSYTGLRIGVSTAKGLAYAAGIPLISIHSLKSLAKSITVEQGLIVPMLDARRLEVYAAVFDSEYNFIKEVAAEIIDENSFSEFLTQGPVTFLGDGAAKCEEIITHPNASFIDGKFPSTKEMCALAEEKFQAKEFEDVAYFEPFYLKDFVVTPSKK
ncbi:tRNA (adenosine(37)-N6)-threonylcarbamoyltransferase complex dimerization subunit type 1 TsaB [Wenyingzhuangia sp. IMCC45574]